MMSGKTMLRSKWNQVSVWLVVVSVIGGAALWCSAYVALGVAVITLLLGKHAWEVEGEEEGEGAAAGGEGVIILWFLGVRNSGRSLPPSLLLPGRPAPEAPSARGYQGPPLEVRAHAC